MKTTYRITPNSAQLTKEEFPCRIVDGTRTVALFTRQSDARAIIRMAQEKRQTEDDASRYRAMYLGAASHRRSIQ
jgi:hypothetical protein